MNIVYSASDKYSELAGISITSLLVNNTDIGEINVIILDNGISEVNKEKLCKTVEKYNRKIIFVSLNVLTDQSKINMQRWNASTFGRLFEATMLPDIDKVIHIDCDTVVCGSVRYLWDLDMSNTVVAGAPECLSLAYKKQAGLKAGDPYINAGVIVMNLKRIRELNLEYKFAKYIEKNGKFLTFLDQEVINACVPVEEKIEIPLKYNSYSILHHVKYQQLKKLRRADGIFSEEEYDEAVRNPIILHYTSCFLEGTRPWIDGDSHPRRESFLEYKNISQWAETPDWPDKKTIKSKLVKAIVKLTPTRLLIAVVGFVHGVYLPKRNNLLRKGYFG